MYRFVTENDQLLEPPLYDLGASLRAELRLEAEEAEREAARSAAMRRTTRDVAADLMAHGDTVIVTVAAAGRRPDSGLPLCGVIRHVGADYLTVGTGAGRVDVRLDAVGTLRVAERALTGGQGRSAREAPAWRARMLELELTGEPVQLGLAGGEELTGRIAAVGVDHVGVEGAMPAFVPFVATAYVRTQLECPPRSGSDRDDA